MQRRGIRTVCLNAVLNEAYNPTNSAPSVGNPASDAMHAVLDAASAVDLQNIK